MSRLGFAPGCARRGRARGCATAGIEVDGVMTHLACRRRGRDVHARASSTASTRRSRALPRAAPPAARPRRQQRGAGLRPADAHAGAPRAAALRRAAAAAVARDRRAAGDDSSRRGSRLVKDVPPGRRSPTAAAGSRSAPVADRDHAARLRRRRAAHARACRSAGACRCAGGRAPVAGHGVHGPHDGWTSPIGPRSASGNEAVLFGDDPDAWDVADWAGTNAWQVLTGDRVARAARLRRAGPVVAVRVEVPAVSR